MEIVGMTVSELHAHLGEMLEEYGDAIVVMSKDAEGNGFSPLCPKTDDATTVQAYYPDSTYSGEIGDYDEADDGDEIVIVLWPIN